MKGAPAGRPFSFLRVKIRSLWPIALFQIARNERPVYSFRMTRPASGTPFLRRIVSAIDATLGNLFSRFVLVLSGLYLLMVVLVWAVTWYLSGRFPFGLDVPCMEIPVIILAAAGILCLVRRLLAGGINTPEGADRIRMLPPPARHD